MKFDDFLKQCVNDSIENGSGDWPENAPRPGTVVASEVRSRDWRDVNAPGSEQEYDLRLGYRKCASCGREHLKEHLEDGWCPQCNAASPEDLAAQIAEAKPRYRRVAADWRARGLTEQADELDAYVDGLESKGKAS